MTKKVYLAGDIMSKGSQMQRQWELNEIKKKNISVYDPKDEDDINDKKNMSVEENNKLAEKIVKKDSENIYNADVVIIEPQRYAEGTICELGQLKGRRDFAKLIKEKIKNNSSIEEIEELIDTVLNQKIFAHLEDIRRTSIPEIGDRRSFYVNQYVYGVTLDLTKGKGFEEFEDILNQIE